MLSSARIMVTRFLAIDGKSINWGCGAAGSALAWHARGHGFDPRQLHF